MWGWRAMEIRRNVGVKNEELLHGVKEESKIRRSTKRRANLIGRILRESGLLKRVLGGKVNIKRKGERRNS
jgi:hypothetical protein